MDPYKVLGVSYDASDDEIKSAYRKLSRQYHPDANVGKPNQAELEEKFKEVQQAYQMIMDRKKAGDDPWSRYQQESQTDTNQYIRAAVNYINNGYYREGMNVLEQIPEANRDGEWYYVSAVANYKTGNNGIALEHAKRACDMDPNNGYYRMFLNQISGGGQRYQSRTVDYGYDPETNVSSNHCSELCATFLAFNLCCGGGYVGLPLICCI